MNIVLNLERESNEFKKKKREVSTVSDGGESQLLILFVGFAPVGLAMWVREAGFGTGKQ